MDQEFTEVPVGSWETLREGTSVAILAMGPMLAISLEAADRLNQEGIYPEIINARYIKPLDEQKLLELINRNMDIVTVEEGSLLGGFGSAVLECVTGMGFVRKLQMMGLPDEFIEHGSVRELRVSVGLTAEALVGKIRQLSAETRKRMSI
jgi:1-deoxy-D-xylulose-5-phosphate synthase